MFPQIVIGATIVAIAVRVGWIVLEVSVYGQRLPVGTVSIEGVADSKADVDETEPDETDPSMRRELILLLWAGFAIGAVFLFGFYGAAFFFPLVYIYPNVRSGKHSLVGCLSDFRYYLHHVRVRATAVTFCGVSPRTVPVIPAWA